jgi:hypothetical protein
LLECAKFQVSRNKNGLTLPKSMTTATDDNLLDLNIENSFTHQFTITFDKTNCLKSRAIRRCEKKRLGV